MRPFTFDETWRFAHRPTDVYAAIREAPQWPSWWPGVRVATDDDVTYRCAISSPFRYSVSIELTVTTDEPPHAIEVEVRGDLRGSARGELTAVDPTTTTARYRASIAPATPALVAAATLVRPLLQWNHDTIMRRAARRLDEHLSEGG